MTSRRLERNSASVSSTRKELYNPINFMDAEVTKYRKFCTRVNEEVVLHFEREKAEQFANSLATIVMV